MADDKSEQTTEQKSSDEATVDTGAGDDEVVVVQQGDDLVSFQGGEEVDRRSLSDDEATAEGEGASSARNRDEQAST